MTALRSTVLAAGLMFFSTLSTAGAGDNAKAHTDIQNSVRTRAVAATPEGGIAVLAFDETVQQPTPTLTVFDADGAVRAQWGASDATRILGGSLYSDESRLAAVFADSSGYTIVGPRLDLSSNVVVPTCQRIRNDGTTVIQTPVVTPGLDLTLASAHAVNDGIILVAEQAVKLRPDCSLDTQYGAGGRASFAEIVAPPGFVFDARSMVSAAGEVIRIEQVVGGDGRTRLILRKLQASGAAVRPAAVLSNVASLASGEQVRLSTTGFARTDGNVWLRAGSDARPCLFAVVRVGGAELPVVDQFVACPDTKDAQTSAALELSSDTLGLVRSVPFGSGSTLYLLPRGAANWQSVNVPSSGLRYVDTLIALVTTQAGKRIAVLDTARRVQAIAGVAQPQGIQPRAFSWQPTVTALGSVPPLHPSISSVNVPAANTIAFGFFNSNITHFFVTADVAEALSIDRGSAGAGWFRTTDTFYAWASAADAPAAAKPVCRFYGTPGVGPNSHFYTANPAECAAVRGDRGWTYEGVAFYVLEPDNGACATGTQPIYRFYNNGFARNDSNHRYTPNPNPMAAPWTSEGVVFCVPT